MADLKIKPSAGTGNKLILQSQDGTDVLTTSDSGLIIPGGYYFSNLEVFTASGTWTKPSGVTAVYVIVTGAGGGSHAAGGGDRGSGGGGAGGTAIKFITSGLGSTETVTVGPITADAGDGGDSSFGSHCTGTGGDSSGSSLDIGGEGNLATGGDINITGGGGSAGGTIGTVGGGLGGASWWGGGREAISMGAGADARDAEAYGSGAGGSGSNGAGGKGMSGIVVVYEYKG